MDANANGAIRPNEMGRHLFGTHAVNDLGPDIYPVQSLLGHADPETAERNAQMRPIQIARILDTKAKTPSELPRAKNAKQVAVFSHELVEAAGIETCVASGRALWIRALGASQRGVQRDRSRYSILSVEQSPTLPTRSTRCGAIRE